MQRTAKATRRILALSEKHGVILSMTLSLSLSLFEKDCARLLAPSTHERGTEKRATMFSERKLESLVRARDELYPKSRSRDVRAFKCSLFPLVEELSRQHFNVEFLRRLDVAICAMRHAITSNYTSCVS
jgi:hypothetical protein